MSFVLLGLLGLVSVSRAQKVTVKSQEVAEGSTVTFDCSFSGFGDPDGKLKSVLETFSIESILGFHILRSIFSSSERNLLYKNCLAKNFFLKLY